MTSTIRPLKQVLKFHNNKSSYIKSFNHLGSGSNTSTLTSSPSSLCNTVFSTNNNKANGLASISTTIYPKKRFLIGQPTHETHPHLLKENELVKHITINEFKERRNKLLESFEIGNIVVLFTPPEPMMSYDIPWHFRQNTNFYYYSGFNEPEAVLVLEKTSNMDHVSYMFVRERNPARELWDGARCGAENVKKYFGIDYGHDIKDNNFEELIQLLTRKCSDKIVYTHLVQWDRLLSKLHSSQFKLYNIEGFLQKPRMTKSASEIEAMKQSGAIAGESFEETMKYIKPGMNEYEISAFFEWNVKKRGAQRMSYPPVVANGNNANTLHYVSNNDLLVDGQLVLMDAGCEHWGYTSDITRTFPINGRFTEAQKKIYDAVLDVNKRCIAKCVQGESIDTIHRYSVELINEHLKRLGILHADNPSTYVNYYPHSIGHYLGMDTHDTLDFGYGVYLEPNMIITIEPGIYIPLEDVNVPQEFRGIAIRVEDDVVIAKMGDSPIVLTKNAPKEIQHIESIMNNK
ncbi:hypothetical protein CYY_004942 [Polysphondylium violaceum]|uniref:Aminopeptidase P N-terminal domain-containing protein n=1 Tax=Polysphondylium violaceum TaxID=133409 RepID=A0A8J4UYX8_9MYCE|nr:hypothetical protein CYY_004942 [Polysphondylium violaceum]